MIIYIYVCRPINPLYHPVISCANPMLNQRQFGHLFSDRSSRCSRSCTQQLPGCFSGCQSYANISGLGGMTGFAGEELLAKLAIDDQRLIIRSH